MTKIPYKFVSDDNQPLPIGMIVLQTDETVEPEFKRYFADDPTPMYVTRIPSGLAVTPDSLSEMQKYLPAAADLLPKARPYSVVGYGCTSASSIIGSEEVERLVQTKCDAQAVTNPLRAAVAHAAHIGISKLALLSPYIEDVNIPLRRAFAENGLSTDVFGTFAESEESKVVRIAQNSIIEAATQLGNDLSIEGVFLSCTNLRTIDAIPEIERRLGKPVLSSNRSLAWHIKHLATDS